MAHHSSLSGTASVFYSLLNSTTIYDVSSPLIIESRATPYYFKSSETLWLISTTYRIRDISIFMKANY